MLTTSQLEQICAAAGIPMLAGQPMSEFTTFRIGGPAELILQPDSIEQLAGAMRACKEEGVRPLLMGNGSDLLVCDEGIRRPVIQLGRQFARMWVEDGDQLVCEAGASLAKVCTFAWENALTGLEFAYGIPGNVGGAVYMNAGAYGGEIKDVVACVTHVTPEGEVETICGEACDFGYRHSAYTDNGCCIAEVRFQLQRGDPAVIRARMDDLMERRRSKQPLEYPSAGSTFKRPVGGYASALIDQCGLKGRRVGGAMVSEKHAGFLINYDHATCADMLELIRVVQEEVKKQTGFELECEIKHIVG
ncbi:UDP-N-acetylmuramate dehydrogenase [Clostridiaceae bacterium NSJ-31]|uniref:UDP-N-acetylenolpyruvoylglucosamine reductase n=1 Tax=Ligaoa zhengdingensis TaxID=2763658 RepID=A0A926E0P7_9FIRM|nr:UDP-N-acetylmuramate dehydrogenase [Ligaoa zhengdingensis]MBC8546660.1 UDP-N-acetylmuramate dehydrogenase [Ligaoa zhengdingensis]